MLIPALPLLTLRISGGDAAKSSMLYGMASFTRYALEFFSAPVLGSVADVKGRKIVLVLSFLISAVEFVLLGLFPSIPMIFLTRAISGLGDAGVATSYAVVTDIAMHNGDIVSQQYSLLAAMTGIGFIIGPYVGGLLCEIDISVCFLASSVLCFIGSIVCFWLLEETVCLRPPTLEPPIAHSISDSMNPVIGLKVHLANPKLQQYIIPFFLCTMNTGMSFLWYLYMAARYHSTPASIGIFLSFHGVMNAFVLGIFVPLLIPRFIRERDGTLIGLILSAMHKVSNGLCTAEYQLYIAAIVFGLGAGFLPAFKSVIVHDSLKNQHGAAYLANLQGAISSVRTLATATGALIYSFLFSAGVSMQPIPLPQLPYYVAGAVYLLAWFQLRVIFAREEEVGAVEDAAATISFPTSRQPSPRRQDYQPLAEDDKAHDETDLLSA